MQDHESRRSTHTAHCRHPGPCRSSLLTRIDCLSSRCSWSLLQIPWPLKSLTRPTLGTRLHLAQWRQPLAGTGARSGPRGPRTPRWNPCNGQLEPARLWRPLCTCLSWTLWSINMRGMVELGDSFPFCFRSGHTVFIKSYVGLTWGGCLLRQQMDLILLSAAFHHEI